MGCEINLVRLKNRIENIRIHDSLPEIFFLVCICVCVCVYCYMGNVTWENIIYEEKYMRKSITWENIFPWVIVRKFESCSSRVTMKVKETYKIVAELLVNSKTPYKSKLPLFNTGS